MFEYIQGQEMHIHLDDVPAGCLTTYCLTEKAIEDDIDIIHTTQTHFCSWIYHRRIFVHVNGEAHTHEVIHHVMAAERQLENKDGLNHGLHKATDPGQSC